jgi:hypothetical protein
LYCTCSSDGSGSTERQSWQTWRSVQEEGVCHRPAHPDQGPEGAGRGREWRISQWLRIVSERRVCIEGKRMQVNMFCACTLTSLRPCHRSVYQRPGSST